MIYTTETFSIFLYKIDMHSVTPEQLATCFQSILTGQHISDTERQLQTLSVDPVFLTALLEVPNLPNITSPIAKSAMVYTLTYIKAIHPTQANSTAQQLLQYVMKGDVSMQCRKEVAHSLQILIQHNTHLIQSLTEYYINAVQQAIGECSGVLLCGQLLMEVEGLQKHNVAYRTLPPIMRMMERLMDGNVEGYGLLERGMGLLKKYVSELMQKGMGDLLGDEYVRGFLTKGLALSVGDSSFMFCLCKHEQSQHFHKVKAYILDIITTIITHIAQPHHPITQLSHKLLLQLIPILTQLLPPEKPYYQLAPQIISLLSNIYSFINACVQAKIFYQIFVEYRDKILWCVLSCMTLSSAEYNNFYNQPDQFYNYFIHLFYDRSKQCDTLRDTCAVLLISLCRCVDGMVSEVFCMGFEVLEEKSSRFSKIVMMIGMCVLHEVVLERKDVHGKMAAVLLEFMNSLSLPTKSSQEPQNMEYTMGLFLLNQYFYVLRMVEPAVEGFLLEQAESLIKEPKIERVPKFIAYDIVSASLQWNGALCVRYLSMFYDFLGKESYVSIKFLQTLRKIVKQYGDSNEKEVELVVNVAKKVVKFLLDQKIKNKESLLALTSEAWHVISEIVESQGFASQLQEEIENVLESMYGRIDGKSVLNYEQHLFQILKEIVERTRQVTLNHLKAFEIIPRILDTCSEKRSLDDFFSFLQAFIFYGAGICQNNRSFVKEFIGFCIKVMDNEGLQAENSEGVLLIQSLILAWNSFLDEEDYKQLLSSTNKRLQSPEIEHDFLKANLVTNLALILMNAAHFFQPADHGAILAIILREQSCFSYQKCSKTIGLVLCQLLPNVELIGSRFVQFLDYLITIMQVVNMERDEKNSQQLDEEEVLFRQTEKKLMNSLKEVDEYDFFREQGRKLEEKHPQLLQKTYNELPRVKQEYFQMLLSMKRIGEDSRRLIKLKR